MAASHGHVTPRPDGLKARCGGPAICPECAREAAQKAAADAPHEYYLSTSCFHGHHGYCQSKTGTNGTTDWVKAPAVLQVLWRPVHLLVPRGRLTMAGSWRRQPLPPGWAKIRAAVLERDGHQCTIMLTPSVRCPGRGVVADHIDQDGPQADLANLRTLCLGHDKVISSGQGGAALGRLRRQMAAARKRPSEPHPGLR